MGGRAQVLSGSRVARTLCEVTSEGREACGVVAGTLRARLNRSGKTCFKGNLQGEERRGRSLVYLLK